MRPIYLKIEGLRSFKCEPATEIEFDNRDQLAIVGETGAGKSSILEAMTWALYGQTSYSAHANQELINDESSWMRVTFRFWAGSHIWTARRTAERRGDGSVGPATATLEKTGDSDESMELVEGVQPVNRRTQSLLGLDVNAFLRTIVLPQGRFARLLAEDEPRNRANILRQVWHTGELERAADDVCLRVEQLETLQIRIETTRNGEHEDPEGHSRELDDEQRRYRWLADRARANEDTCLSLIENIRTQRARYQTAATEIGNLKGLDLDGLEETARYVEAEDRQNDRKRETAERTGRELARQIAALGGAGDRKNVEAAEARLRNARTLETARTQSRLAAELLQRTTGANDGADSDLEKATARRMAAESLRETSGRRAAKALNRANQAATRAENARDALGVHEQRTLHELALATRRREQDDDRAAEAAAELRSAVEHATAVEQEALSAERHQQQIERRHHAHCAAANLASGDDCPICERTLPAEWSSPAAEGLERAQAAAVEARAGASRAQGAAQRLRGRVDSALAAAADSREQARRAVVKANEAREACATALDLPVQRVETDGSSRLRQIELDAEHLKQESDEANFEARTAGAARTEAEEQERAAREVIARTSRDLAAAQDQAKQAGDEATVASDACRRDGWNREANPETWIRELEERADRTRAAFDRRMELHNEEHALKDTLIGIERVRNQNNGRRHGVQRKTDEAWREIAAAAGRLGIDIPVDEAEEAGSAEAGATVQVIGRAQQARGSVVETAVAVKSEALAAGQELRSQLENALETSVGGQPAENEEETTRGLRERTESMATSARQAESSASAYRKRIPEIRKLERTAADVDQRLGQLREIAKSLKSGAFPKWVTLRRSTELLRHASGKLKQMTRGRYAFRDPRDTEEQWKVLDRQSGATRAPATLSGGEQFIASLALALGMVETMGQRGGRLEAFFLDEGFGTLDTRALDTALDGLEEAATPEHMVGVITHVRQVAERIPHVLAVTRSPGKGSTARWLSENERLAVGEGESEGNQMGLTQVR